MNIGDIYPSGGFGTTNEQTNPAMPGEFIAEPDSKVSPPAQRSFLGQPMTIWLGMVVALVAIKFLSEKA